MLEHSHLLVHLWIRKSRDDFSAAWVRPITDAKERPLGFVQFDGSARSSWFSWLKKIRLDVFETDDASHLMTLTRSWGVLGSWDVEDAELRPVGTLYTKTIVTSDGLRLGFLDCGLDGQGRILDLNGSERVRFATENGEVLKVNFVPESAVNPFMRMLFLGSILTLDPTPPMR